MLCDSSSHPQWTVIMSSKLYIVVEKYMENMKAYLGTGLLGVGRCSRRTTFRSCHCHSGLSHNCSLSEYFFTTSMWHIIYIRSLRGGVKKQLFFLLSVKKGGGLGQCKKSLSENTQIFWPFLTKNWVFFDNFIHCVVCLVLCVFGVGHEVWRPQCSKHLPQVAETSTSGGGPSH